MLVFHFNINGMYNSGFRNRDAIRILINHIPTTFFTIWWNMTVFNILENSLMEVSNIVIIRLISLAEDFVAYNFFPR